LIQATGRNLGRYLEPALWVLIALDAGPLGLPELLDGVRRLDGPMGHGSLLGSLARLERLQLVEKGFTADGSRVYRLTILGRAASRSTALLKGQAA
jgi:DNA-binding PadR family transcriptional regulator